MLSMMANGQGARVLTTLARLLDPLHGVPDATRQRFEDWYRQAAIPQIRYVAFLTMGLYLIYAAIEQNVETDQPFARFIVHALMVPGPCWLPGCSVFDPAGRR